MKFTCHTLLVLQLLLAVATTPRSLESLTDYLESHDLSGVGNTKHCFGSYLPQLEQMGAIWTREFNACEQNATTVRANVMLKVQGLEQWIRQKAATIDNYIQGCLGNKNVLNFFDCFGKLSKQQLINMYQISFNASDNALRLSEQLNGIDTQRYICTNRTEQTYVLDTARLFTALDKCLQQAANTVKTTD